MRIAPLLLAAAAIPVPLHAAVELAVGRIDAGQGADTPVELIALNPDAAPAIRDVPARLSAADGTTLRRAPGQPVQVTVPAGGFVRLRYLSATPSPRLAGLSLPEPAAPPAATDRVPGTAPLPTPQVAAAVVEPPSADGDRGNAFLGNLSAYEAIYAVYGPGTNSDGRLQISFKYQLLGDPGQVGAGAPWQNGIHFAYTQRLYWDLGASSSPFRNIDYMPEIFYLLPARPVGSGRVSLGGQAGFRHESNGRDGAASRSLNTVYVQPMASLPVGDYKLTLGPRLWLYTGDTSDNPDIRRYRGNTGLFAEFGQDDGLRISATGRLNPGSGKGAINTELSYPLDRIVASNLNLYVFGQAFAGYGENLLDYDRRQTRLRIGIGIVR